MRKNIKFHNADTNNTDALATNVKETTDVTNVIVPSEESVINAKKWVDENEK